MDNSPGRFNLRMAGFVRRIGRFHTADRFQRPRSHSTIPDDNATSTNRTSACHHANYNSWHGQPQSACAVFYRHRTERERWRHLQRALVCDKRRLGLGVFT